MTFQRFLTKKSIFISKNIPLITIVGALLFNLSFLFINNYSFVFLIISFLLNFVLIYKFSTLRSSFKFGFLWGLVIGLGNFFWVFELFVKKTDLSYPVSFGIYIFTSMYLAFLYSLYFVLLNKAFSYTYSFILRLIIFILISYLFFLFIFNYMFILWMIPVGYPFLNPLLPLAKNKFFIYLFNLLLNGGIFNNQLKKSSRNYKLFDSYKIEFIKPVVSMSSNKYNLNTVAMIIYSKLSQLKLEGKNYILLSPETYYPFILTPYNIEVWYNLLPNNTYFFLNSQRRVKDGTYKQTTFIIKNGKIIDFYDKCKLTPFGEYLPFFYKKFTFLKSVFMGDNKEFSPCDNKNKIFNLLNTKILIQTCFEFFFNNFLNNIYYKDADVVFVFINDSWFNSYLKKLMLQHAYLVKHIYFKNVHKFVYVSHSYFRIIN